MRASVAFPVFQALSHRVEKQKPSAGPGGGQGLLTTVGQPLQEQVRELL